MRHNIAVISWDDAWIDTDDFVLKDANKAKGVRRHTVGWLIKETDEGVVLCTDYYQKKKDGFNSMMYIPWGWIEDFMVIEC